MPTPFPWDRRLVSTASIFVRYSGVPPAPEPGPGSTAPEPVEPPRPPTIAEPTVPGGGFPVGIEVPDPSFPDIGVPINVPAYCVPGDFLDAPGYTMGLAPGNFYIY